MTGAHPSRHFGMLEWVMSFALAAVWGSSFLWIAVAVDRVDPPVVPLLRCAFGAAALFCLPAARRRIDAADLGRVAVLGLVWMAVPFLLYPIAEQTVSTSITGMINGALPVVTTAVTAVWIARVPSGRRIAAVLIGGGGIAVVSLAGGADTEAADARGIATLLTALAFYAIAVNLARPLQDRYGSLPLMLWVATFGTLWSVPLGAPALARADMTPGVWAAMAVLGAVGTGMAFALYGRLLQLAGPVRGMIGVYFSPVVAVVLGVAIRDEALLPLALGGLVLIVVGAVLTSRGEESDSATRARPGTDLAA